MKTLMLTDSECDALIATIDDLIRRFEYNDNGPDQFVCDFCGKSITIGKLTHVSSDDIIHASDCQGISLLDKLNSLK